MGYTKLIAIIVEFLIVFPFLWLSLLQFPDRMLIGIIGVVLCFVVAGLLQSKINAIVEKMLRPRLTDDSIETNTTDGAPENHEK